MKTSKVQLIFASATIVVIAFLVLVGLSAARTAREPEFANVCINHLRCIDAAKSRWAERYNAKAGTVVSQSDLFEFISDQRMLKCPLGGTYRIGKIGETPTCSLGTNVVPAHALQ
jgi:hypothetical protein